MCIPIFDILALKISEKTVTQKNLTELRSNMATELRTDQIQDSPPFSKRGYNKWKIKSKEFDSQSHNTTTHYSCVY